MKKDRKFKDETDGIKYLIEGQDRLYDLWFDRLTSEKAKANSPYYTLPEVACIRRVTTKTVLKWIAQNRIEAFWPEEQRSPLFLKSYIDKDREGEKGKAEAGSSKVENGEIKM